MQRADTKKRKYWSPDKQFHGLLFVSSTRVYVVDRSPGLELNLEPVQDEDAGRYRCVASVGGQTYERQLFLTVRGNHDAYN